MRMHFNQDPTVAANIVRDALKAAKEAGQVAPQVHEVGDGSHGSRSHTVAIELTLRADYKVAGDKRRRFNSGTYGAGDDWAATYDEWGWLLTRIFDAAPSAKCTYYRDRADFHRRTRDAYRLTATV